MNQFLASIHTPGRRTVLAALLASLSVSAFAEPANVVISQVYGGGGNSGATFRHDFIEIFNRGSTAVTIGGWSVQYASSTGSSWQVTAIPDGVELQPGQYYMIREAAGTAGTADEPADIVGTITMTGTAVFSREASARMIARVKELSGARNERGEVEVPFRITGSIEAPVFGIDTGQILGRALQKEIQRNIRKGLDRLFRRP